MTYTNTNTSQQSLFEELGYLGLILIIFLSLVALPGIVIGILIPRFTARERWNIGVWFLLCFIGGYLLYHAYTHGLPTLMSNELIAYTIAIKALVLHSTPLNLSALWSLTWPVWQQTLATIPFFGLYATADLQSKPETTKNRLHQERQRDRRYQRSQRRAARRTRHPERLPDSVDGMMVIGVPIKEREQEEVK